MREGGRRAGRGREGNGSVSPDKGVCVSLEGDGSYPTSRVSR